MKKALTVLGNTSSHYDDFEHSDDAFMEKADDDDANEEVTLSCFKKNLNTFSISKLRKLVIVLINLISELMTENDLVKNIIDISQDETQIFDIQKQIVVLEAENLELEEKMKRVSTVVSKEKKRSVACSWSLKISCTLLK